MAWGGPDCDRRPGTRDDLLYGLLNVEPRWVLVVSTGLTLHLAGAVCIYLGTKRNRHGTEHSLYFIPLQVWGWIYLGSTGAYALLAIAGAFKFGLNQPGRFYQAIGGLAEFVFVVVTAFIVSGLARQNADSESHDPKPDSGIPETRDWPAEDGSCVKESSPELIAFSICGQMEAARGNPSRPVDKPIFLAWSDRSVARIAAATASDVPRTHKRPSQRPRTIHCHTPGVKAARPAATRRPAGFPQRA